MIRSGGEATRLVACVAITAIVIGCGTRSESSSDSAGVQPPVTLSPARASVPAASVGTTPNACPSTGRWALCSLEKRLKQAGFVLAKVDGERPTRPGFSVQPTVYTAGRGKLEVFIYVDEQAAAKDIAGMDTTLAAPPGVQSPWESTPVFVRSGNLAVVYLTSDGRQAERLMLAITAGAPQPASPH